MSRLDTSARSGDHGLLTLLERGAGLTTADRATLLVGAQSDTAAERLPLGERNACILGLRSRLLGPLITANGTCPHCAETAVVELDCRVLIDARRGATGGQFPVSAGDYDLVCSPPTAADLAAAVASATPRLALIASAVLEASRAGEAVPVATLPDEVVAEVGRRIAERDPLAEVSLALVCADCGGEWEASLDVSSYVWTELQNRGRAIVAEVNLLASAYGWTEQDVLAVPPRRRRAYLSLVLGE